MASTVINDDFCAVSFRFSFEAVELEIAVDGFGSIWSSLSVENEGRDMGWLDEAVLIDLESVEVLSGRRLSFTAKAESGKSGYAALEEITLHPCIDCDVPGGFVD